MRRDEWQTDTARSWHGSPEREIGPDLLGVTMFATMPGRVPDVHAEGLPRIFWVYMAGAALVAGGFADFQLIAYHFEKADAVKDTWIPVTYAIGRQRHRVISFWPAV